MSKKYSLDTFLLIVCRIPIFVFPPKWLRPIIFLLLAINAARIWVLAQVILLCGWAAFTTATIATASISNEHDIIVPLLGPVIAVQCLSAISERQPPQWCGWRSGNSFLGSRLLKGRCIFATAGTGICQLGMGEQWGVTATCVTHIGRIQQSVIDMVVNVGKCLVAGVVTAPGGGMMWNAAVRVRLDTATLFAVGGTIGAICAAQFAKELAERITDAAGLAFWTAIRRLPLHQRNVGWETSFLVDLLLHGIGRWTAAYVWCRRSL